MDDIEAQIEAEIDETEAIAVTLAMLARPVRGADIPAAVAVEMLAECPALIEEALRLGEGARVAVMVEGRQCFPRVCRDEAAVREFFAKAEERGANMVAISPARVRSLIRTIRRTMAVTLKPAISGGLSDAALH